MTEKNEGNTALRADAIVDIGDAGPGLALVADEAPEGAFFSAELYTAVDTGYLRQLGENAEPTGIVEGLMEHLGILYPHGETDAWATYLESLKAQAGKLSAKNAQPGGLDDARLLQLASHEREIGLIQQRIDRQTDLRHKVSLATEYYENEIGSDFDKIEHIYDITSDFEHTTLLAAIRQIGMLMKPRRDARGGSRSHPNQHSVAEAERIVRILVADENDRLEE